MVHSFHSIWLCKLAVQQLDKMLCEPLTHVNDANITEPFTDDDVEVAVNKLSSRPFDSEIPLPRCGCAYYVFYADQVRGRSGSYSNTACKACLAHNVPVIIVKRDRISSN